MPLTSTKSAYTEGETISVSASMTGGTAGSFSTLSLFISGISPNDTSVSLSGSSGNYSLSKTVSFGSNGVGTATFSIPTLNDGITEGSEVWNFSLRDGSTLGISVLDAALPLDNTAPTVTSFSPLDASNAVGLNSNITLTFSEAIQKGTGNIEIRLGSATGALVESFSVVGSNRLTFSGSTLTIDPTNDLLTSSDYFVVLSSDVVKDLANNSYIGNSKYHFITEEQKPTIEWIQLLGLKNHYTLTTGKDGTIYVAGGMDSPNVNDGGDVFITRYNVDGTKVWSNFLVGNGWEAFPAITTGTDGAIYVTGSTTSSVLDGVNAKGNGDVFIARYNPDGTKVWTRLLGGGGTEYSNCITTGTDGAIYIAGSTTSGSSLLDGLAGDPNTGSGDAFISRYNTDGTKEWTKLLGGAGYAYSLAAGFDGAIYVAGNTRSKILDGQSINGPSDAFITRYNQDGTKAWTKLLGGNGHDYAWGLTVGLDGAIYVTGSTTSSVLDGVNAKGVGDAFITRYSVDGTKEWTKLFGGSHDDIANCITIGTDGAIYVAGTTLSKSFEGQTNNIEDRQTFITCYEPNGTNAWIKLIDSNGINNSLTTGTDGAIYLAGSTSRGSLEGLKTNGFFEGFIIKFPINSNELNVSGTTKLGQTLTVSNNLVENSAFFSDITYTWKSGNATLGTGTTYTLSKSDVGKSINVAASYTDVFGTVQSINSPLISNIENINDSPTGSVSISGIYQQGQKLTVSNNISDADGLGSIGYTWKLGSKILGTGASYTLSQSDVGKSIFVIASYIDGFGTTESVISNATGIVTGFLIGTDQSNTLIGTDFADEIHGLAGDDFIIGGDGADELDGGVGNDFLDGGAGDDILSADSNGYSQLSTISGSLGMDTLIGGAGNDIANMFFDENHYLFSRNDNAVILTNKTDISSVTIIDRTSLNGVELISFNNGIAFNISDLLSVIATSGNDNLYQRTSLVGSGGFVIDGLEGNDLIKGSTFSDHLSGGKDKDFLVGFSGDDTLSGGEGRDYLSGGEGNDYLDGGAGIDLLIGGTGDDIYVVDSLRDVIIEKSGRDTIKTQNLNEINLQRYRGIESAEYSGTGDVNLIGNHSSNSLIGGAGSDTLTGKFGNDTLSGAGGSDKFVFNSKLDAQFNFDLITDFSTGSDKLVLDKTIFTRITSAVLDGNLITGTNAQDSDDYLIYDSNTQTLYYDADGNAVGAKVAFAQLIGVNSLSSSDFSLI